MILLPCKKPRMRGFSALRSSISWVLILSKGVTAKSDSVKPAPKPATTVLGPEILPFSSWRVALIASKATNPISDRLRSQYTERIHPNPHHTTPQKEGIRTNSGLERVSNDQRCAPRIPLLSKWRPWEFLTLSEAAIELCAGLCDCGRQLVPENRGRRVGIGLESGPYTRQDK